MDSTRTAAGGGCRLVRLCDDRIETVSPALAILLASIRKTSRVQTRGTPGDAKCITEILEGQNKEVMGKGAKFKMC